MSRRELAFLAAAVVLSLAACGGGGGGGGGPIGPTPSIVFTPAGGGTTDSFALVAASSSADELVLDLVARSVEDLYSVSCDVTYPAALRFNGFTPGTLLASGGASISVQVVENPPGRLVIGATRLGDVGGIAGANGAVLALRFQALAAGSGSFGFVDPEAFDDRGESISGLGWSGGSVVVVR